MAKKEKKKPLADMSVDELLRELRNSQGPGDALMEFNPSKGVRITHGK